MDWSELERRQPRLGALGRQRLLDPGVVLVGTIRRDGTPRISPVEPWIMDGVLWLSMMWGSTKAADLLRDPRTLVHNPVSNRDGLDRSFAGFHGDSGCGLRGDLSCPEIVDRISFVFA